MYLWGFDVPAFVQAKLSGVSERVTYQWNQYMRDVASTWLIQNQPMLGGKDVILQIDESIIAKQKCHRGHLPAGAQKWVFGIYDTAKKTYGASARQKCSNIIAYYTEILSTRLNNIQRQMEGVPKPCESWVCPSYCES